MSDEHGQHDRRFSIREAALAVRDEALRAGTLAHRSNPAKPLSKAGARVYCGILLADLSAICFCFTIDATSDTFCFCLMYFLATLVGVGIARAVAGRPYAFVGALIGAVVFIWLFPATLSVLMQQRR